MRRSLAGGARRRTRTRAASPAAAGATPTSVTTLPREETLIAPTQHPPAREERHKGALSPYVRAIEAHRLVVVAITLTVCAVAVGWHAQRTPTYEATAKILLTPLPSDDPTFTGVPLVHESNDPTRTVQTAAALLESPQAAQDAARLLGRGYTRDSVTAAVEVRPQGQSNIIAITAGASEPQLAVTLADTYAQAALARRNAAIDRQIAPIVRRLRASGAEADQARARALDGLGGDPTLSISQPAVAPAGALGQPAWVIALLGLVAGFTLAATAALVMDRFGRRVSDEQELADVFPLPVLARVPKVRDRLFAGGDLTAVPSAVREAYRMLQIQVEQLESRPRVVMVTSGSGGEGKTSTAIGLALELVATGHRVLLMDLDVRKPDLTRIAGLSRSRDVTALGGEQASVADLVVAALPEQLLVLPGGNGDRPAGGLDVIARSLPAMFAEARAIADYVVVDTAPLGWVSDALRLAPHIDAVLLAVRPGTTERARYERLRDLLTRAGIVPAGVVMVGTPPGDERGYPHGTVAG
jgi:Mrp family chromosome partitioning ATPase/capsular polysaccharide biosynthesis protein